MKDRTIRAALKAVAIAVIWVWSSVAMAQNQQCRTAPVGTSTANCASEAFVTESVAAAGDVKGPGSSLDNGVPRFDGTTGKLLQGSGVVIDDSNNVTGVNSVAGSVIATKSQQQTGSSATTVVTPSQQQSHDSAAKAWITFTGSTGASLASYNVSSITRTGTGEYTVNFTTAFASANYMCQVTSETGGPSPLSFIYTGVPKTASLVHIAFEGASGAVFVDPTIGHMVCFGRQ